jgi:hypothetical protein
MVQFVKCLYPQGNFVLPQEVSEKKGADILRLSAISSDFEGDIRISPQLIKHVEDVYRRLRNTFFYLLGGLSDFLYLPFHLLSGGFCLVFIIPRSSQLFIGTTAKTSSSVTPLMSLQGGPCKRS